MGTLDSITQHVPTDGPLVIVTASFEGEPADNAAHFVEWLQNLKGAEFDGLKYAVFGCGNRDWVRTFQRIPKLIDGVLEERGGKRLLERGVGDAQAAEFFEVFDEWEAELWKTLAKVRGLQRAVDAHLMELCGMAGIWHRSIGEACGPERGVAEDGR